MGYGLLGLLGYWVILSLSFSEISDVKNQVWQWFLRTKWVVESSEVWANFEFLEIHRCPEGAKIGF